MKPSIQLAFSLSCFLCVVPSLLAEPAAPPMQPAPPPATPATPAPASAEPEAPEPHAGVVGEFEDLPLEDAAHTAPTTLPRDASLELPEWHFDDVREFDSNNAPVNLGGGLWPAQLWPLMPVPNRLPPLVENTAPLVLRERPEGGLEPIPPSLNDTYFGQLPPENVLDPQSLLNEVQQEDLGHFFEEYALRQAGVKVRMLVIGGTQAVPPTAKLQKLVNQWFPLEKGLVVIYPMGEPKAAECYFSKSLQETYTPEQLNAVRDACVKEAMVATKEEDQISRYGIKLAVRMNRLREEPRPVMPVAVVPVPVTPLWKQRPAQLAAAAVLGLTLLAWLSKKLKRSPKAPPGPPVWLLPDQEMSTRLSAPHCGGTMAIVKFR